MKIDLIISSYSENSEPYHLGTVESELPERLMVEDIKRCWAEFKFPNPNWDGNFLNYLYNKGYNIIPCNRSLILSTD